MRSSMRPCLPYKIGIRMCLPDIKHEAFHILLQTFMMKRVNSSRGNWSARASSIQILTFKCRSLKHFFGCLDVCKYNEVRIEERQRYVSCNSSERLQYIEVSK